MNGLGRQDNGNDGMVMEAANDMHLVDPNQMILNLKIASNNLLARQDPDDNADEENGNEDNFACRGRDFGIKATGSNDSTTSTASTVTAPEVEALKMAMDQQVMSLMASPPQLPTTSPVLNFGLPSPLDLGPYALGASTSASTSGVVATSTPMMGKLRHYKKELMYNSLLRPHVAESSTTASAHAPPSISRLDSTNSFASSFSASITPEMSPFFNPANMFNPSVSLASPPIPSLSTASWSNPSQTLANYQVAAAAGMLSPADLLLKLQEQAMSNEAAVASSAFNAATPLNNPSFSSPPYASGSGASSTATATPTPGYSMSPPPPPPPPPQPQIMPDQVPTHVGRKPLNGPPCSLKILVDDNILDPMPDSLTYDVMGVHFSADLLANGFIRIPNSNQVFTNPSSWATFCRTTIPACSNKDAKHFGSAWSTIRYMGKRLDSYKLRWYRKQKKTYSGANAGGGGSGSSATSTGNANLTGGSSLSSPTYGGGAAAGSVAQGTGNAAAAAAAAGSVYAGGDNYNNHHNNMSHFTNNSFNGFNPNFAAGNSSSSSSGNGFGNGSMTLSPYTPSGSNQHQQHQQQQQQQQQQTPPKTGVKYIDNVMSNLYSIYPTNNQMRPYRAYNAKGWSNIIPPDQLYMVDKASYGDPNMNSEEVRANAKAIDFNTIDVNNPPANVRVKCIPFYDIGVVQPFLVTISTNALLLIDFHMHLIQKKVFGYLVGTWDPRTQVITVAQAFPCKGNTDKARRRLEVQVKRFLKFNNMILVGWYHSHPTTDPNPTLADIKQQIACERAMFENQNGFITYSPCVGLIASPRFMRIMVDENAPVKANLSKVNEVTEEANKAEEIVEKDVKIDEEQATKDEEMKNLVEVDAPMDLGVKKAKLDDPTPEESDKLDVEDVLVIDEDRKDDDDDNDNNKEEVTEKEEEANTEESAKVEQKEKTEEDKDKPEEVATLSNGIESTENQGVKRMANGIPKDLTNVRRNYSSLFQMFWVLPIMSPVPTLDIGRPFQISYKIIKSEFLTQELLLDMKTLALYYHDNPDYVDFNGKFEDTQMTEWDKLKLALRLWLPRDLVDYNSNDPMQQQAIQHFWRFLHQILIEKRTTL